MRVCVREDSQRHFQGVWHGWLVKRAPLTVTSIPPDSSDDKASLAPEIVRSEPNGSSRIWKSFPGP